VLARQSAVLNTHTRYLHEGVLAYAERLLAAMPAAIGHVMFTCTGSEANDLALRVARAATGGTGVVVTANAYHGVTMALAAMSPSLGPAAPLGPNVRAVPPPREGEDGTAFARDVAAAFEDLRGAGVRPCALLADTIFSSDGVRADPAGFLAPAVEAARAAGAVFVADEVQAGLGRVGPAFWGFARHGVEPDLVTCGKPMGAGHPVACVALRPALAEAFGRRVRYFNTFGGNPVSAAVGLAVLDVIAEERLAENAASVGDALRAGLERLGRDFPALGEVRGAGLSIGVTTADGGAARRIVNDLRRRGVLISATGPAGDVLKIRPPLPFSRANAAHLLGRLEDVLRALRR
jgi:4-aminobutyrate aminotransferase-like enzyme